MKYKIVYKDWDIVELDNEDEAILIYDSDHESIEEAFIYDTASEQYIKIPEYETER